MVNKLHYFNSHGCKITFINRQDNMSIILKKRKFIYVLPEVIEIIDRVEHRIQKEVMVEDVSFELSVHPAIIYSIFIHLKHTGLLGKEEPLPQSEIDRGCYSINSVKRWSRNVYPILREVKEEDYGKNIKIKKEQTKHNS
jgi:hypothetical protein